MATRRHESQEHMKKHLVAAGISTLLALGLVPAVHAAERPDANPPGFYGGVSLRDQGKEAAGLNFGLTSSAWTKFTAPVSDDTSSRALLYGGYRWSNDIAVEAAFASADKYALHPVDPIAPGRGVGLNLAQGGQGLGDLQTRSWNLDVYTSWSFRKSFSLYGRLGYAQADAAPAHSGALPAVPEARRLRDGVNYGVGLRYDMNSALGLRVEYGRFGRFAGEYGAGPAESDQVSVGLQLRF